MLGECVHQRGFRILDDRLSVSDHDSINRQISDLLNGRGKGRAVLDEETKQPAHAWKLMDASGGSQEPLGPSADVWGQVE